MGTRIGSAAALAATLTFALVSDEKMPLGAQGAAALTGTVASREEPHMEGVVISARADGSNFSVSVVSDASGRFSFPRTHLHAGAYRLSVRAVGFDLIGPGLLQVVPNKTASVELTLTPAADVASQLSSLEWANSLPGTPEQKNTLVHQVVSCAYCHTYRRMMRSKLTADQLVKALDRMQAYYPDGTAVSDDGRGRAQRNMPGAAEHGRKDPEWGYFPGVQKAELAEYVASFNLSGGRTGWAFPLKTLPRPQGKATRVIVTEWDMPRKDTVPHDMDIDSKGAVWYTDESRQFLGTLDPRTNSFTEFPMPPVPEGDLPGTRDIEVDQEDIVWFNMRVAKGATTLARFDPRTEKLTTVDGAGGQYVALGPDGKIWAGYTRVDPKTLKVERAYTWQKAPNLPPGPHAGYVDQTAINSKGDVYINDIRGSYIVRISAESGDATFWPTPTRRAMPRRARMDQKDIYWFAEYLGDRVGRFDTRTEMFTEWPLGEYTTPYAVSTPDKNGFVYASSNMSERLIRLDPRSGEQVGYQMPANFDTKKIAHDPTTNRVVLWMANTRSARIVRVEPLE